MSFWVGTTARCPGGILPLALENAGASPTTGDLHKHSSGVNTLGPWLLRAELVCDGESQPLCCPGSGMDIPAASRVTEEDTFYLFSIASNVCLHRPSHCLPFKVTQVCHWGKSWDRQPHCWQYGCSSHLMSFKKLLTWSREKRNQ